MKVLHLIRHAKSSWDHPELHDHDRPLNERGKAACGLMADKIWEAGCHFENTHVSTARRAQDTVRRLNYSLKDKEIKWTSCAELYTFSRRALLNWLGQQCDEIKEMTIVGHNPALTNLIEKLSGETIQNLPTCGYVQLRGIRTWSSVEEDAVELENFIYPKKFDEGG